MSRSQGYDVVVDVDADEVLAHIHMHETIKY